MILNKEVNQTKTTSPTGSSANQESTIRILKSYYNKDACDSVKRSFLTLEKEYYTQQQNQQQQQIVNKSNGSISSVCSSASSATHAKTTKLNTEKTRLKKLTTKSTNKQSSSSPPSCILFVNQLVDNKLEVESNAKLNITTNTSILKEITETASDTYDGYDYDYDAHTQLNNTANKKKNKKKQNSSSSISSASSASNLNNTTTLSKKNLVQIGYKFINKIIKSSSDENTSSNQLKNSSNSSSSLYLSSTLKKSKSKDQLDSSKMYQSEFIYSHPTQPPQQQAAAPQLQLLNNKKLRKLLPFNSGLKNHGNTCFMNSILQCLFHTSPLADFFITDQFQHDMQFITNHEKFNQLKQQQNIRKPLQQQQQQQQQLQQQHNSHLPQFILTKHFYRLLSAMWRNTYDSNYSAELKHLIGYMNPTFAGGNQNDSHELCVWLLDKLSQELTIRIETPISPQLLLTNAKSQLKIQSSSFIEDLFQVQFKSTVVCSKCNYQSIKHETDMMLSLPLPQFSNNKAKPSKVNQQQQQTNSNKSKQRRSLYAHLVLANHLSIKNVTEPCQEASNETNDSRSRFYVNNTINNDSIHTTSSNIDPEQNEPASYTAPFHVKIGVNIQITNSTTNSNESINLPTPACSNNCHASGESSCSSVSSTTSSISSTSSAGSSSSASSSCCPNQLQPNSCRTSTVLNPSIGDLRRYISATYQLRHSDLVFIDLNRIHLMLADSVSIKDNFLINKYNDFIRTNIIDSMCVVELNCPSVRVEPQMPLINVIGINVYYETMSPYALSNQSGNNNNNNNNNNNSNSPDADKPAKKCVCYGLPFALLINRDCSYSDLCKKLLEAQFKYFKDKIMLKYKDLVEKLFTLSLNDPDTHERIKLNPNDELPLYAECVEKFINNTLKIAKVNSCAEFIKLNIEWRSFEDISNLFKDIDSGRPEYVHKTVRMMKSLDESELTNKMYKTSLTNIVQANPEELDPITNNHHQQQPEQKVTSATLNDCFELFTQREELTDENSWMCPKCKKQTNASKKLCISTVPPILIIHLKRFFYKSKSSNFKLTTPVWFPTCNLDISKYISTTKSKRCSNYESSDELEENDIEVVNDETRDMYNQSYVYDLFAVCNHKGQNMANGHYTSFCKNLIDTKWYCFDDSACTPLFDHQSSSNQANLFNNGSTNVCSENAYILFYKKRNCMRNEKWWIDYVDKSLLDSDEFDRFVTNLEAIELEQQKYQVQQQEIQLMQKQPQQLHVQQQQTPPQPQLIERNINKNNINGAKKSNGMKTLRKWINNGTKTNAPPNNPTPDEELNALRRVLYDDQYNTPSITNNYQNYNTNNVNDTFVSSNCTSVDSELVAINRQAEQQRIQQRRFEEAINVNYNLNKQVSATEMLPFTVNQYNETNKPTRLVNKQKTSSSSSLAASRSSDSINQPESVDNLTPVNYIPPPTQQQFVYNKEFKKPYTGYFVEYKIPIPPMPPTPTNNNNNHIISSRSNTDYNNPSLESNERYYLNLNTKNVRINDEDASITEDINNVSSYHNNQSSSNFSTVDSLLSYPSDNEYMYTQNDAQQQAVVTQLPPQPPSQQIYNTSLVQEYIINSSKAFYTSNRNQQAAILTPIQEHQQVSKNHPLSPPYFGPMPAITKQTYNLKQTPVVQPRMSNLKSNQQANTNRYMNTNSIETPI